MKKSIAALVAGATFALVPAAYAAEPVKLSGDVSVTYEKDTADGQPDTSGVISSFTLKGEMDLGSNWSLYARLGAQKLSKAGFGDFNASNATDGYVGAYAEDDKAVLSVDQFGFVYQADKFTYRIGRQDTTVGTTALLYSRPDSNIGKKAFVDGVSFTGKTGVTDLDGIFAREDNVSGEVKNKVYAVRGGYNPQENLNVGLTLARYQSDASTNHWAVDGTYTMGKSSLTGEYTKSNSNADNQAYATTLNYDFNGKTAAYVTGFRVERNGGMDEQGDFGADLRGIHYGVTHTLRDNLALEVIYKKEKAISSGEKNTAFEATVSYSF